MFHFLFHSLNSDLGAKVLNKADIIRSSSGAVTGFLKLGVP